MPELRSPHFIAVYQPRAPCIIYLALGADQARSVDASLYLSPQIEVRGLVKEACMCEYSVVCRCQHAQPKTSISPCIRTSFRLPIDYLPVRTSRIVSLDRVGTSESESESPQAHIVLIRPDMLRTWASSFLRLLDPPPPYSLVIEPTQAQCSGDAEYVKVFLCKFTALQRSTHGRASEPKSECMYMLRLAVRHASARIAIYRQLVD